VRFFEMVFMFEGETDGGNFLGGALGEVGDGAMFEPCPDRGRITKQDARVDLEPTRVLPKSRCIVATFFP